LLQIFIEKKYFQKEKKIPKNFFAKIHQKDLHFFFYFRKKSPEVTNAIRLQKKSDKNFQ